MAITYVQILMYDTSELIYKTETDSQTQKTNMVTKGDEGKGRIRTLGLTYTLYVYKVDNQGPAQHREPYSVSCENL